MRIVLTGATSGIGLAAARILAGRDVDLVLHGPEPRPPVGLPAGPRVRYLAADFADLVAVRGLAAAVADGGEVDVLVNNAGIPGPGTYTESAQSIELTFQVNHLAGALLTDLLLPAVPAAGRVVNTASATHYSAELDLDDLAFRRHPYHPVAAYARSKLAVVAATCELARWVPQTVVSVHPGVVATSLLHAMFGAGGASAGSGGRNLVAAIDAAVPSGSYLDETRPAAPAEQADDPAFQRRLRELTARLIDHAGSG